MKELLKNTLKILHLYIPLCNWHNKNVRKKQHAKKQFPILDFKKRFNPKIFVETGTFLGEMVYAMRNKFNKIYSIELADGLYERAKIKFEKYPHIEILHGDSKSLLPIILEKINEPALFWLDAHYSGGETAFANEYSPIEYELRSILNHQIKNHVILIDDVNDFIGANGYPTISAIENLAKSFGYECEIKYNNFRIYPKILK